jgi:hypothetical protein
MSLSGRTTPSQGKNWHADCRIRLVWIDIKEAQDQETDHAAGPLTMNGSAGMEFASTSRQLEPKAIKE